MPEFFDLSTNMEEKKKNNKPPSVAGKKNKNRNTVYIVDNLN